MVAVLYLARVCLLTARVYLRSICLSSHSHTTLSYLCYARCCICFKLYFTIHTLATVLQDFSTCFSFTVIVLVCGIGGQIISDDASDVIDVIASAMSVVCDSWLETSTECGVIVVA